MIYAPVYRKHIPYGGILPTNHSATLACGFLDEKLLGQHAIGWVDKEGRLYQLEVDHKVLCKYEDTVNDEVSTKRKFYALVFLLTFLCLIKIRLRKG